MSSSDNGPVWLGLIIIVLTLAGVGTCAVLSEDPEGAKKAAVDFGFQDPMITATHLIAPEWYGCGRGDRVGYEMKAKNAKEEPVSLVVCNGYLKGFSVRVAH